MLINLKNNKRILPLAIIGAGPSGITAAIYAQRANIKPIFTNEIVCGKIAKTLLIENYPGFKSTTGAKFCKELQEQIEFLKISVIYQKVINLAKTAKGLFIINTKTEKFYFEKVIIATGTKEKQLPVKGIKEFHGRGVSYCSSCDGYFFKDLNIAVIGGGNAAVEESKILAQIGKKIIIINRDQKLLAESMLISQIEKMSNVQIYYNTILLEAQGKQNLEKLFLKNVVTQQKIELKVDGLFIYIGAIPNVDFLDPEWSIMDDNKYIIVNNHFETNITNLYAIGDVVSGYVQQYTTAISSATFALKNIIERGFLH